MDGFDAEFIRALRAGRVDREALALAGAGEPESAARAFATAAKDATLSESIACWAPPLLRSADPARGAAALRALAEAGRAAERPLDLARVPALPSVLGASAFLARLLQREPALLAQLSGDPPPAPEADPVAPDWQAIRSAKYRGLLRVAARDLAGRSFSEGFAELSDLADRCLAAALACAARETGAEPPALFALGKLGGRELNFSSDVDLLFLHEPAPDADPAVRASEVSRLIRVLKQGLEEPAPDGFGYRVDLDLRPEGRNGALANSVDAALTYYASYGAEWERQMLLRLRPVTGDAAALVAFPQEILPFVYRRAIDPSVMQRVREMKQRIEDERRDAGRDIEHDLKEGPGGIRDVEFLVQALQLFHGGRDPSLRTGNVLAALAALGNAGHLPTGTADALARAYLWLRRAEHALQLAEERQTAKLPRSAPEQTALARRMGYAQTRGRDAREKLLEDWGAVRSEVRTHFGALVLGASA